MEINENLDSSSVCILTDLALHPGFVLLGHPLKVKLLTEI